MWIGVISIFPDMFDALTSYGITGRAIDRGLAQLHRFNPRDYTADNYRRIDDRAFGGGPGMVMLAEPLYQAICAARQAAEQAGHLQVPVIYLSPQGQLFNESLIQQQAIAEWPALILLCGRYEGVDERLIRRCVDLEWSLGDFVVTGGELPAMTVLDSLIRRLPGAMSDMLSVQQDSHVDGLLDCAHYTRPEIWQGEAVPPVLLSGHHAHIEAWRFAQRYHRTARRRPDLVQSYSLNKQQRRWLGQFPDQE